MWGPLTHLRTAAGSWVGTPVGRHDSRSGDAAGASATGWAHWAVPQLQAALAVVDRTPAGASVAAHLYREWFSVVLPGLDDVPPFRYAMPLAGAAACAWS